MAPSSHCIKKINISKRLRTFRLNLLWTISLRDDDLLKVCELSRITCIISITEDTWANIFWKWISKINIYYQTYLFYVTYFAKIFGNISNTSRWILKQIELSINKQIIFEMPLWARITFNSHCLVFYHIR